MLKKQRLLFLPGFGEDERIFRNIIRYFGAYDVEILDYRTVLPAFSEKSIQLQSFTRSLIKNYKISQNDILIGHSLGGFIAHNIRQEVGCPICLHSSFTDPAKIKVLLQNRFVTETAIQNGFFTSFAFRKGARLLYALKNSKEEMECVLDTLSSYGDENILKLVLLFFNRKKRLLNWLRSSPSYDYAPNLILHPKKDNIISAPDEDYIQIPGDHFSIATYPKESVFIILDWLKELQQQSKIQAHHFHNEIASFKVAG